MDESDLYMQCEEEDLTPWQSNSNETADLIDADPKEHKSDSPPPSETIQVASPSTPVQATAKTNVLPFTSASVGSNPILSNVLQPLPRTGTGTSDQPLYIAQQASAGTVESLGTPVGYILPTGQTVTFLTPAQAAHLITPQTASPSTTPKSVTPESYTQLQVPVTLTIRGPTGSRSITTVAAAGIMPSLGLSPSKVHHRNTKVTASVPSTPPLSVAQVVTSPVLQHHPKVTVEATVPTPGSKITLPNLTTKCQASPTVVTTRVFQNGFRLPKVCSTCGSAYKAVQVLRGYVCRCNPELINSIQALCAQSKKRKPMRSSTRRSPTPSSCSSTPSIRHPGSPSSSSSNPGNYVTTSEILEGAPSPGTGDYDKNGKLIILVEDFYYGRDPGQPVLIENNQVPIVMKCNTCDKKLKNNIKLMNHMKHHMELERQSGEEDHNRCQHCFRSFSTPFSLQCHVETVHSQVGSTTLCKICELSFINEIAFLSHMKNTHKAGEMPYACQVCHFRSSFYQDVINHFRELHKDTNNLQCTFCLKVFKSSGNYQIHYVKHQKKSVLHCNKCRLQFIYARNKVEHKPYHQTHLKPVQLIGIKPGTSVTLRAYSATKAEDSTNLTAASKHSLTSPAPPSSGPLSPTAAAAPGPHHVLKITPPRKRKPVESMLEIMTKFQSQCKPAKKQFCMECNFEIPDFPCHFPTSVGCSLCRYSTCCSRAYANHMISNHIPRKTTTKYLNLYKPCPKLGQLRCHSCEYTTEIGDSMAKHLIIHPDHSASHCTFSEGFSRGYKRFVFIPTDLIRDGQGLNTGAFVPLQVLQVGRTSVPHPTQPVSQLDDCVNLPVSYVHAPSIPIQAQPVDQSTVPDVNCGTEPKDSTLQNNDKLPSKAPSQSEGTGSLTVAQLKIVLYALCFGIPQAANHFDTQPEEVQSLLLKCQLQLNSPDSKQRLTSQASEKLSEWVLCRREQQLPLDETSFFARASELFKTNSGPGLSYKWAVEFLLANDLALQEPSTSNRLLPPKVQDHCYSFTGFVSQQIASHGFGKSSLCAVDELSIFIDTEQLDPSSADSSSMISAFKLVGNKDQLIDVVLASLADGTMLPTMVFLRGEPLSPDAPALPDIIILEANPKGFSDEERLQLWFDKVWRPHVDPGSGGKGLLVMDTYRGHLSDQFLALLNSANTMPALVPCACSSRLQPLEACVGPVLREFLQARWSQHVTEAPQDLIGAEPADLALLLSAWLIEMLDVLAAKPELLLQSFEQTILSPPEVASAGLAGLVRNLTEALVVTTLQDQENEEPETGGKASASSIAFAKIAAFRSS